MIVFSHIPKAAGSSFREGLINELSDRVYLDYVNPLSFSKYKKRRGLRHKAKKWLELIKFRANIKDNSQKYDVVYGHFPLRRYTFIKNAKFAMFFRDPLSLVSSYYYHIDKKWNDKFSKPESLEDFMFTREMSRFYEIFIRPYGVEDIDFIGITEEYDRSLDLFEKMFGYRIDRKEINKGTGRDYYKDLADMNLLDRAKIHLQPQIDTYIMAKRRFEKLCIQYGC